MRRSCVAAVIALLSVEPMANQPAQARPVPLTRGPLILPLYPQSVLDNHPVAYWHLGEASGVTATDSARNHDGTYLGNPDLGLTGLINNWSNLCPGFDGHDDRVAANSLASGIDWSHGFALEIWVRIGQRTDEEHLVGFNSSRGGNGPGLLRDEPTDRFKYRDGEGSHYHWALSKVVPRVGYRYHVVVTVRGGGRGALYVNGNLQRRFTTPRRPPTHGGFFTIGAEYDRALRPESFFRGKVDEVAVYNHSISAIAVKAHWLRGTA
jgi:hypothetical protein